MGRGLVDAMRLPNRSSPSWRDVALVGPTTTTTWAWETRHSHMQMTLRLPRTGLEGPIDGISIEEKPAGHPSRSNGLSDCRETGKEQWDAPCRLCRLHHERRIRIPLGHIQYELPEPVTPAIKVTLLTLILFFRCMSIHSSILMHAFIHPSIAYAIIASQRFASRHEAVVVSFDMSGDRPRFEGRPTKGSRLPRVKQSQGRKQR